MARVVLVHGAFHELWGPNRLAARWAPALLDGMWAAGIDTGSITPETVRAAVAVAFWGDLFRPAPQAPGQRPADGDDDLDTADLVAGLREHGSAAVEQMSRTVAEATQARTAKLLGSYFTDPLVRRRVHGRVARHLTPDTEVVVAHSMGTVIAYEALCANPDVEIAAFVTLGSPLGNPGLVFDLLDPPPRDGRGVWPGGVRTWTNIAAEGDLATLAAPQLAERFGNVIDEYVFNGRHPHDIDPYLTAAATGRAVARGLGLLT